MLQSNVALLSNRETGKIRFSLDAIIAFLIVLTPVMTQYSFRALPNISIFDWILLFVFLVNLFRKKIKIENHYLLWGIFAILHTLIAYNFAKTNAVIGLDFSGGIHIGLYYLVIAVVLPNIRNPQKFEKYIHSLIVFATLYLIMQVVVYYLFHYYISGTIKFFYYNEALDRFQSSMNNSIQSVIRCRSIFFEPSHYAVITSIAMALVLDPQRNDKKSRCLSILYSVGIILSLSSAGIILCLVLWIRYFFSLILQRKISKSTMLKIGGLLFLAVIALIILQQLGLIEYVLNRTLGTSTKTNALYNRVGHISTILSDLKAKDGWFVFGLGWIDYENFLPEFVMTFLSYGVIGCLVLLLCLFSKIKKGYQAFNLLIIGGLVGFAGSLFLSAFSVFFYFALIIAHANSQTYKEN